MINWLKKLFAKKGKYISKDEALKELKRMNGTHKVKSTYTPENRVTNYVPPVHLYVADTDISGYPRMMADPIMDGVVMAAIHDASKDFVNSDTVYFSTSSTEEVHSTTGYSSVQDSITPESGSNIDTSYSTATSSSYEPSYSSTVTDYSTPSYESSYTDTSSVSDSSFSSD